METLLLMRLSIIFLLLLISGCKTPEVPPEPIAPTGKPEAVDSYADANDLAAGKASASVQVAIEANREGKTKVVDKELSVASANLPRPTSGDLKEAKTRAEKQDEKEYEKAIASAEQIQKQIDDLWAKVEAQRAEDRAKANAEIEKMKVEIEAERQTKILFGFAGLGALITLAGVGLFMFGSKTNAVALIAIGLLIGSLGFVWGTPLFTWVMMGAIGTALILGLIWIGKRMFAPKQ
jgi:hypothetical protein